MQPEKEITTSTLALILKWLLKNNEDLVGRAIVEYILEEYDKQNFKKNDPRLECS
jgi:hypothetical protein